MRVDFNLSIAGNAVYVIQHHITFSHELSHLKRYSYSFLLQRVIYFYEKTHIYILESTYFYYIWNINEQF